MATSPDSKPTERQLIALEKPDEMLRAIELTHAQSDLAALNEAVQSLARLLAEEKAKHERTADELRTLRAEHHITTLQRDARERQVATLAWEKEDRDRKIEALAARVVELTAEADRLTLESEKPAPKKPAPKRAAKK